ncbi:MAG: hypothetical protein FGM24_06340 [Candidatus Kapabacteria bacterium]|nr:hypothetical protein [Candidatus Kapabacteria bacterium]
MHIRLLLLTCLVAASTTFAQKRAYVPAYIRDTSTIEGKQFSWDRTRQSKNFLMIWGSAVGNDPSKHENPDLRFDPAQVLDTMEYVYDRCHELGMINTDSSSMANRYKYVIVMYNTYGEGGPEGWANGWAVDDSIGAFWVHPGATRDGGVIAHEFTHSLQAMYHIDGQNPNRGNKAIYDNDGLFYETHANYVRNVIYPQAVTSDIDAHHFLMLEPDWKFNYEGYHFLLHIHQTLGLSMVSRLWTEWLPLEYPLQTLRRLTSMSQEAFNDYMFDYACRAVTWDYDPWGQYLRASRTERLRADWGRIWAQRTFDIVRAIDTSAGRYYSDPYNAPQDYGYNIVPLYVTDRSKPVELDVVGHTEVNDHAGWRYALVAVHKDGTTQRRGEMLSAPRSTLSIRLAPDESMLYLVVLGAPVDSMHANPEVNNTWNGNPKRYHYPWEMRLRNARPEGYQDPELVRPQLRTMPGHRHANGGGWVDDRATVEESVYVGPRAIVAGASRLSGNVRIEHYAYVQDATISGEVVVTDNAFVLGGTATDSVRIIDQCLAVNNKLSGRARLGGCSQVLNYTLGGDVRIDGDLVVYNETGQCSSGEYHVLTQYYRNDLLPCDGRDSTHPQNVSVNRPIVFETVSVADAGRTLGDMSPRSVAGDDYTITLDAKERMSAVRATMIDLLGAEHHLAMLPQGGAADVRMNLQQVAAGVYTICTYDAAGNVLARRPMLRLR